MSAPRVCRSVFSFLLVAPLCALAAQAARPENEARSVAISAAIRSGQWTAARDLADNWSRADKNDPLATFVGDLTRLVLQLPRERILTDYDPPYSNRAAVNLITSWTAAQVKEEPGNPNWLIAHAVAVYKGTRDAQSAVALLERAIRAGANDSFALSTLANLYGGLGRADDAIPLLKRALQIDPKCSTAYTGLGMVAMGRGDRAEAEAQFQKATEQLNAGGMDWFNLGSLYRVQGKLPEARAALERAVEMGPTLIEARYNLAAVYYGLGQSSKSVEQLQQVVAVAPDSAIGQKARQNLRQLGH